MAVSPIEELLASTTRGAAIRRHYRAKLRAARSNVQANAEGFEAIAFVLEDLGRYLAQTTKGLNGYLPHFLDLVERAAADQSASFERRYFMLRQSRNDRMHVGAHARDAARIGVEIALILEDALSIGWKDLTLADVMTPDVVTADPWTTLDQVRHLMLRHAYSVIPAYVDSEWYLLSDRWLARHLAGKPAKAREALLGKSVEQAVRGQCGPPRARLHAPDSLVSQDLQECLQQGMILVGDPDGDRLHGIVSPPDIL